jgi:glucose/mannose-6-phosphate isomerase
VIFDLDESRLDDAEALAIADPGEMLRTVATSGAQIRHCLTLTAESDLDQLVADGMPRSMVVVSSGTSGHVAELIWVLAGTAARIPVISLGTPVPAWLGAADVLVAISASGGATATVAAAEEAGRRGARVLTVGPRHSPLEEASLRARGVHLDPDLDDRPARGSFWSLAVPALRLMDGWGLVPASVDALEAVADLVDDVAERCRPTAGIVTNPAKVLALELAGSLPLLYGPTPLAAFGARRFAATLATDAGFPASVATEESLALLTGPFADTAAETGQRDDFFRDRVEDADRDLRLRLVLLSDVRPDNPEQDSASVGLVRRAAEDRGVAVSELTGVGTTPLERVATLTALSDFASVYLALALGVDPTRTNPLDDLRENP